MSGYGLGFICGLQLASVDQLGPAGLAIFLCLGESHFYYMSRTSSNWVGLFAGLGIDDMFALVTTCQNLTELEMMLPREEKLGLVIILIKSLPINISRCVPGDEACWCCHHNHHLHRPGCLCHRRLLQSLFCQVSASVLPSRTVVVLCSISFVHLFACRNFCLFAIFSLSFVYLYICTFFLAALAIDQMRIGAGRWQSSLLARILMETLLQRRLLLLPEARPP